jgi:hypothetical protein
VIGGDVGAASGNPTHGRGRESERHGGHHHHNDQSTFHGSSLPHVCHYGDEEAMRVLLYLLQASWEAGRRFGNGSIEKANSTGTSK